MYVLGMYLGDGCLTPLHRDIWKLRIAMDARYQSIVDGCQAAVAEVAARRPGIVREVGWVEVYSCWKHWLCVFPQHGPGRKHLRLIELADWQRHLVQHYPDEFIKGLIHSDGCRTMNRIKGYAYPRYVFSNRSADLRELFVWACGLIGVEARQSNRYNISVAKRRSVEILDAFIGPKR